MAHAISGVWVPAVTPFDVSLNVDEKRFTAYCRWLLDHGANGLAVFGTTSEATSLGMGERQALLEKLIAAGIPPAKLLPGTGLSALPETVALTRHAVGLGCAGVLMLPPFYYKNISDDGLVAAYSETIERVNDARLRLYLYHIPQMSGVPITLTAMDRLVKKFPQAIVGIKDSSGNWDNTKAVLTNFPQLTTFPATEARLLEGMGLGAAGCISASANMNISMIADLIAAIRSGDKTAASKQQTVAAIRQVMEKVPVIAAMKAFYARATGAADWAVVRPPLSKFGDTGLAAIIADLEKAGFHSPTALKGLPG